MKNTILVLSTYKYSLGKWEKSGLLSREIRYYELMKKHHGLNMSIMTYDLNDIKYNSIYTKIKILPKLYFKDFLFSVTAPLIYYKDFKNSIIIKSNQSRGAWTGLIVKLLFPKKYFVMRCGWVRTEEILKTVEKRKGIRLALTKFVEKLTFHNSDAIIVTTPLDKKYIANYYNLKNNKIFIIPNSIDTSLFKKSNKYSFLKKPLTIIAIGRFIKAKNFDSLIIACKNINEVKKLILIGSGSEERKYKKLSKNSSLAFDIISNVNNAQIPDYLKTADLFVMPQKMGSGMSKVILEAMSTGLITIASDIPPHRQNIKHGVNGFLCKTDPKSIESCLKNVINMDKDILIKVSKCARENMVNNYSMDNVVSKEYDIYKKNIRELN